MTTITIELPIPHRLLHKNGRTRAYLYRAMIVRNARRLSQVLASSTLAEAKAEPPRWKRATLHAAWYFKPSKRGAKLREHDDDGLVSWIVPYRDGLQDAGIIANDSGLTHLPHTVAIDAKHPRVVLTVEAKQC